MSVPPPLPKHHRPLKWVILALVVLSLGFLALGWFYSPAKPRFPWQHLEVEHASLSSFLNFNPLSNYPPRHRWAISVQFKKLKLHPDQQGEAPYFSYELDLNRRGWSELPGTYDLHSRRDSDFSYGDDSLGSIDLDQIEIRPGQHSRFEMVLHLTFNFEDSNYRPEKRQFTIPVDYKGFTCIAPTWNNPDEVTFPADWGIPSNKPHWSDEEIRTFVAKYVDLTQYREPEIEQSDGASILKAKPR